ncbi:AmmeMemoRadiSam system protein B [Caldichromatium japonicum]|uniref:MEMO1 family protein GWK36_05275 n=1 Tax=Caldichromatium japonicum TaxID=2699430 RepID=A0A6G7VC84_9GAMM|nr:AmmeMemoRadiSam system protein B [Caldichromatium japonicum]QIK37486.1 AmmeMemoRadiSam system protein B [Caldichromatium japonicum]
MLNIRQPAVADRFYPGDPQALTRMLDHLLAAAHPPAVPAPKALIVPHAGYVYSGPVAATAYATLAQVKDRIERVVLLGPSHRVPFHGLAAPSAAAFATPLGLVPIDRAAIEPLLKLPQVQILDAAHAWEHSLEVQLPFLQRVLADFKLVPLVAGESEPEAVAEVLDRLWGGPQTLILVSSDLTHYLDYHTAQRIDAATSQAIEFLRPEGIGEDQACGRVPLRGLLTLARRRGLKAQTLDLRNSGDTAGGRDQVVGYGAYALFPGPSAPGRGEGAKTERGLPHGL